MKLEQQELARDLYLHTDKTQSEIADILGVDRKSVYYWMKNGKWEQMKRAALQAPGVILQDIYNHIQAVNDKIYERAPEDRCPTMEEVNKLKKLIGITKDIPKKSAGTYVQVFEELMRFAKKRPGAG